MTDSVLLLYPFIIQFQNLNYIEGNVMIIKLFAKWDHSVSCFQECNTQAMFITVRTLTRSLFSVTCSS